MPALDRNKTASFNVGETPITVSISPCSWMYANYGLQLHFKLPHDYATPNGGHFEVLKKPWATLDEADFQSMVDAMAARLATGGVTVCASCGGSAWNRAMFPSQYRDERCERCFMAELQKQFDADSQKQTAAQARKDARQKAKGFNFRVDAWVHPTSGDDKQVGCYMQAEPSKDDMAKLLKAQRSNVLTDYKVLPL